MKNLILISGTMGAGKTAVSHELRKILPKNVFLDGDWCWMAQPFVVTDETKEMVMENITFLLAQFLRCSAYENVIFCWVLHQQSIQDAILKRLDTKNCDIKCFSLTADEKSLRERLEADVRKGIRTADVIDRSIARIPLYLSLNTIQIDTSGKNVPDVAAEIKIFSHV